MDFSGVRWDDFEVDGTRFVGCDFSEAKIDGSLGFRRQSVFEDCRFLRTDLRVARPDQARFVRCEFSDALLAGWATEAAEFIACRFSGRLHRIKFWGRPAGGWLEVGTLRPARPTNEFVDNDFADADIEDVSFVGGIDLDRQRLPSGPQYVRIDHAPERLRRAHADVATWPAGAERDEAVILLEAYLEEDLAEQDQLFVHRWETDVPRDIAMRVWAIVESMDIPGS